MLEDDRGEATILNDDAVPTKNPGGVFRGLQLWLQPNNVIADENGKVQTWQDSSQGAIDLGQETADSRPTLATNGLKLQFGH